MTASVLVPHKGKGKEIFDYLKRELGLPPCMTHLELRFSIDEPIKLKAEFNATAPEQPRGAVESLQA